MKFPAQKTAESHNQELFRNLRTKFRRKLWKRNRQNTCSHSSLAASTLVRVPVSTFFVRLDFCIQARPQYNENMALIHSFILEASTALINSKLHHSCTIKRKKDVSSKRTLNIWQFGCVLVDMQSQFYFTGECRLDIAQHHDPLSNPFLLRNCNAYLGDTLDLRVHPHAKKPQQTQAESDKEHCFPTHKSTGFHYFHCAIIEDTLVELLTQLIHHTCNQIKASWLQSWHQSLQMFRYTIRDWENAKKGNTIQ
jgi:hypothetical protein